MPQPKRGTTSSNPSSRSTGSRARSSAGRSAAAKAPKSGTTRAGTGRASAAKSTASKPATARSSAAKSRSTRSTASSAAKPASRAKAAATSAANDVRMEAVAQRLRKLNERIIEAGREAGETTLTSYEKALKAIANGLEKGPGRSDIDWLAHLATAQAKFIRDVTDSMASAARDMLK
jgi:hypothetical protein